MQVAQPSVLARDDTFFGVCQSIGEDFGFNPNWLRAALGVGLIWNPVAVIGGYAAAGVVVAFSRWLVREPVVMIEQPESVGEAPAQVEEEQPLAIAA